MKKLFYLMFLFVVGLTSCDDSVSETVTYKINEPVFMSNETFRSSVKVTTTAHAITNYGKMCYYEGYLYISESGKGIHIIDDRNPAQPQIVGFIELLGNADLSIRNNLLYADSYIDLVWFDITNPATPELKGRLENVFPTALPAIDNEYGFDYAQCYSDSTDGGVVVGWELVEKTENIDEYTGGWYWGWGWRGELMYDTATGQNGGSTTGINGSMSRFTLYDNKLYAVLNDYMTIFDLTTEQPTKAADNIYIGWNVETIFSYKDNMFMGTPTGMVIYSVKDPLQPVYKSRMTHAFGCDPVVVDNDLAYITVHSGNNCGQNVNQLIIVDVKDVEKPTELATYAMTGPKGLGINDGKLFICDDGLKIYKITAPETLMANKLAHFTGLEGFDVIPFNSVLMMIAEDGLYQYDYSDLSNIHLLSKIPFTPTNL